jgi:hypothetical protein
VTIHLAPEHAEAAHQALAVAGDTIGPMIGKLLGLDAPAAPAAPKPNRTRQRKRWWLASCRGWARSTATTACWRRASEARLTGLAPAAAAKPTPFKGNARSKSKSRNKGKRRGR